MSTVSKYNLPVALDGFETTKDVDTSAYIPDARTGIWTLYDLNSTEIAGALTLVSAGTVRISVSPALPEGEYLLVGIA